MPRIGLKATNEKAPKTAPKILNTTFEITHHLYGGMNRFSKVKSRFINKNFIFKNKTGYKFIYCFYTPYIFEKKNDKNILHFIFPYNYEVLFALICLLTPG